MEEIFFPIDVQNTTEKHKKYEQARQYDSSKRSSMTESKDNEMVEMPKDSKIYFSKCSIT
jgi:hypothetical protein